MLTFMRKHQKYFFIAITIVIITSFSFFGTYDTLGGNSIHEQIAFNTVAGVGVTRGELDEFTSFISTDSLDKIIWGGIQGPNFLNDGVIRNDILMTGLGTILAENYKDSLYVDFASRLAREQRYKPYARKDAPYINSIAAWNYFAPEIPGNLQMLQSAKNPLDQEAFDARVQLFLNERRFPAYYLAQVLKQQEKQYSSLPRDPTLDREDLSLFGYHTVDDWFGPRFVRLTAEFIINAAAIAEKNGYTVTKEETLADLYRNAEISFKQMENAPTLAASNSSAYFDQQLAAMRLDKVKAVKIWQKVLLFRRLFGDVGSSTFVDPFAYQSFNQYGNEYVKGDIFKLPSGSMVRDFKDLQLFETYLNAISKRSKEERSQLELPQSFLAVEEVAKKSPELVRKRYELEISTLNKRDLQADISVKEVLNWELEEKNWTKLKEKFPELALKKGGTRDERLAAIDALDPQTKFRLDQFAKDSIFETHPEWITKGLDAKEPKKETVSLALKGENRTFKGLQKGESLISRLDKEELIDSLTFNGEQYYRIKVIQREPKEEILTFSEARASGVLDKMNDQLLELHYVEIRGQNPTAYQNPDKSYKPLAEVKDKVAASYYSGLLASIKESLKKAPNAEKYQALEGERVAPYRFLSLLQKTQESIEKKPETVSSLTQQAQGGSVNLTDQFKPIKTPIPLTRKESQNLANGSQLFQTKEKSYTKATPSPNGDLYFVFVEEKGNESGNEEDRISQVERARYLLGSSAERSYLESLIPLFKEKNAITLEYLDMGENSMEPEA
jgi:GcvH upstream region-like protein